MDARDAEFDKLTESIKLRYNVLQLIFPEHELLGYYLVTDTEVRIAPGRHESFCHRFPEDYRNPSFLEAIKGYNHCLDLAIQRLACGFD